MEFCECGTDDWKQSAQVNDTLAVVKRLVESREYFFRVKALNGNGLGDACETLHPVLVKEQVSYGSTICWETLLQPCSVF